MTRGRKPDTAASQDAKGNPGKRLTGKQREAIASGAPTRRPVAAAQAKMPAFVRKSPEARRVWNLLAPHLLRMNALYQVDAFPFGRYCHWAAQWIAAQAAVQAEGAFFDAIATNGEPTKKLHPALKAMVIAEKALADIEERFGMNPSARYKLIRDQALAHDSDPTLPLFAKPENKPAAADADKPSTPKQGDLIGVLDTLSNSPPGTLPN